MKLKSVFMLIVLLVMACQSGEKPANAVVEVAPEREAVAIATADEIEEGEEEGKEEKEEMEEMEEEEENVKEEEEEEVDIVEEKVVTQESNDIIKGKADVVDPGLPRIDKATEKKVMPDEAAWDELLSKYVSADGKVNYQGLKGEEGKLDSYLEQLASNPVSEEWSRAEQMAYWINAYNAYTIKLILDNYPLKSIMDLDGGKPWDRKWINLDGKTLSLNDIEHVIIRPKFKDPRIHFAVNCAAKSCPPIPNQAFTAENLDKLLDERTKSFINNENYNEISDGQVKVSSIFDWYGEDFGNLTAYLNKYSNTKISEDAEVGFLEYDWALNQK